MNKRIKQPILALMILLMVLSQSTSAHRNKLTPYRHPQNASYYVCYHQKNLIKQSNWSRYYQYHYQGCLITTRPCRQVKGQHKQTFDWFKTYPLALNAYYRCAYS